MTVARVVVDRLDRKSDLLGTFQRPINRITTLITKVQWHLDFLNIGVALAINERQHTRTQQVNVLCEVIKWMTNHFRKTYRLLNEVDRKPVVEIKL